MGWCSNTLFDAKGRDARIQAINQSDTVSAVAPRSYPALTMFTKTRPSGRKGHRSRREGPPLEKGKSLPRSTALRFVGVLLSGASPHPEGTPQNPLHALSAYSQGLSALAGPARPCWSGMWWPRHCGFIGSIRKGFCGGEGTGRPGGQMMTGAALRAAPNQPRLAKPSLSKREVLSRTWT